MRLLPVMILTSGLSVAVAQTNLPVTVSTGPATLVVGALPTTETMVPDGDLTNGGSDPLRNHWWFFRGPGQRREYAFKDDGMVTRVASGSSITTTWIDLDGRGDFSATLVQTLVASGAQGARLEESMTLTNLRAAPLTLELFAIANLDAGGNPLNIARGNRISHVVQDGLTQACEFRAEGASRTAVAPPANLLADLTDIHLTDLAGWSGQQGVGDYGGAFQWSLSVPANGSVAVDCTIALLDCRPNIVTYGTGTAGTTGLPNLYSEYLVTRAQLSSTAIRIENGLGNSLSALLLGTQPTNQNFGGINVLVVPNGTPTLSSRTFPNGTSYFDFQFPGGTSFCGLSLFAQGFVLDFTSSNGLASSTRGVELVLGGW